jgi:hypothetical protein
VTLNNPEKGKEELYEEHVMIDPRPPALSEEADDHSGQRKRVAPNLSGASSNM